MDKRVLIVDDAALIRTMLREIIHGATSHTVVGEAENGLKAIDAYIKLKPDIVFMDAIMPEMDGFQVTKAIMRIDPNAKIVMCSSEKRQDDVVEAFKLGVKDYIVKPFDLSRVITCLDKTY